MFFLPRASLLFVVSFCVFGVFSVVCFELLVPVHVIAVKTRLRSDLLCVEQDVKLYSLTHSFPDTLCAVSYTHLTLPTNREV